jgi:D-beta-D-heptose 7-phosphate kinase/D-beta-D-heptose 1-phosphate adenosyltransferase
MTLFRPDTEPWHQPAATPRAVYDVTGAGDTVVSVLALALASGAPLVQAIQLANVAASIVVGKLGSAVVTPDELREALAAREPEEMVGIGRIASSQ